MAGTQRRSPLPSPTATSCRARLRQDICRDICREFCSALRSNLDFGGMHRTHKLTPSYAAPAEVRRRPLEKFRVMRQALHQALSAPSAPRKAIIKKRLRLTPGLPASQGDMESQSSAGEWPSKSSWKSSPAACGSMCYAATPTRRLRTWALCKSSALRKVRGSAVREAVRLLSATYPRSSCRPVGVRRSEDGYVHINLRLETLHYHGGHRQDRHVQAGQLPQTRLTVHDSNYAHWLLLSLTLAACRHQRWTAKVQPF